MSDDLTRRGLFSRIAAALIGGGVAAAEKELTIAAAPVTPEYPETTRESAAEPAQGIDAWQAWSNEPSDPVRCPCCRREMVSRGWTGNFWWWCNTCKAAHYGIDLATDVWQKDGAK